MDEQKFMKQLKFLIESDKMKNIFRQTLLTDKSRRENDAEHSWHLALMALVLSEYASEDVDINRVIKMVLVHDLVEIYAGDTFAYDEEGYLDKAKRENDAADKLFGMLPAEQGGGIRSLWEEFDAMETPDSVFASALDRLQPFVINYITEGHTWKNGNVTSDKVIKRMEPVVKAIPELKKLVDFIISDSVEKGYLKK